ncbi:hypothetical protein GQ55_8G109200 [Panicum hallii var. hallii]|uniref:Uncharacterized protein n=1 Tax=Panicum hallii var. hallii TaxID=1504633 RepID=A0A2T7CMG0_9POAL|nr:hypothetical protein GQ55_8G109200 [Panicum hallii var. hallii]
MGCHNKVYKSLSDVIEEGAEPSPRRGYSSLHSPYKRTSFHNQWSRSLCPLFSIHHYSIYSDLHTSIEIVDIECHSLK